MKPQEKLDKAFNTISAKIVKNMIRVKQMLRDWQRIPLHSFVYI